MSCGMLDRSTARDEDRPTAAALIAALQENWLHARHVENLRERQNYLYWVAWGAILAYLASSSGARSTISGPDLTWLFVLMAVFSAVALSTSLKWTAEFGNHIAAVYYAAEELGLNKPAQMTDASPTRGIRGKVRMFWSTRWALPYPEFRGYMALPLDLPIFLSVGPTMIVWQTIGLAVAIFLAAQPHVSPEWTVALALLLGLGALTAVTICVMVLRRGTALVRAQNPADSVTDETARA